MDPERRRLTFDGTPVALRPTLFLALLHLVRNPDRVIGKDEFLDAVWDGKIVEEANLSQTVFWLRAALREQAGAESDALIVTVRREGYRFTAPVAWEASEVFAETAAPEGGKLEGLSVLPPSKPWRKIAALGAALAAIVVLLFGGIAYRMRAPHPHQNNTVVLADFQNSTGDPIFDHTLASILRIDLGQSPYIAVMPEQDIRDVLALMTKPKDAPVTVPVAEEICTRANANAVLNGGIYALGKQYVVTLTGTDCSGRQTLAAEKIEVARREDVIASLDHMIASVRARLGEPIASIDQFNVPLVATETPSLDALKAFSEGMWLMDHGKGVEAEPLFKQAIDLDPGFADAYANLGIVYGALFQPAAAAEQFTKAYQLREKLNQRERLRLTTLYDRHVTRNFDDAVREMKIWTSIYPRDLKAWGNLADLETILGKHADALAAAQKMMALHPNFESAFDVLARAQQRVGRPDLARATADLAIRNGLDGAATHELILEAAFMQHDVAAVQKEAAWSKGTGSSPFLIEAQAEIAYAEGRVRDGDALYARSALLAQHQGLRNVFDAYQARLLIDLDLPDRARPLLATPQKDDDDFIFATAEIGDQKLAQQLIDDQLHRYPGGTSISFVYAPQVRAALALRNGKAAEAVADLVPGAPYLEHNFDIPYILGRAYLAEGAGAKAAAVFQRIVENQGWYPVSPLHTLAKLGLARALRLEDDRAGARRAYRTFLADWHAADPDQPLLKAAKAEYAALG